MILDYALTFFTALVVTLFVTPLVKRFAISRGAVDHPDERKIHASPIPRWGGLGIFLGICFGIGVSVLFSPAFRESAYEIHSREILAIIVSCLLMLGVGIVDDLKPVPAKLKLAIQLIAAFILVASGVKVTFVSNPITHQVYYFKNYLGEILTVIWIIGITNALNLLDGLDGLLSGISTISALALFFTAINKGYYFPAFILLAMSGSTLAFLRYNFNPARIFLGDSGSLLIGMLWASLSIAGALKTETVTIFAPLLILGIPIADTLFAVLRRFGKGQSIFEPDKDHLHHRLLRLGWPQRKAVLVLYAIAGVLGILAYIIDRWY